MLLLRFIFGIRRAIDSCSAKQGKVGATLRITATFPKLQRVLSPKKVG